MRFTLVQQIHQRREQRLHSLGPGFSVSEHLVKGLLQAPHGIREDHAHSESDYTAMIQGKAAAQVPFNAETTDIKGIARMIVRLRDAQMHGQQT